MSAKKLLAWLFGPAAPETAANDLPTAEPRWLVNGRQRLPSAGHVAHRSKVFSQEALAVLYAERLAAAGFDVCVYRLAERDAGQGPAVRFAPGEPVYGWRPTITGRQRLGVG